MSFIDLYIVHSLPSRILYKLDASQTYNYDVIIILIYFYQFITLQADFLFMLPWVQL